MSRGGGQIRRTNRAELDLVECAVSLSESSDEIAMRFIASVEETAERLLHSPHIGKSVELSSHSDQRLR